MIAQVLDQASTPVGILMVTQGIITTALSIVYRDCRKDRETLWAEILELKKRKD